MVWKLINTNERKFMKEIYEEIFNLWNSNSYNKTEYENLIEKFEKVGISRTKIKFNKRATVCGNFVIEIINDICKI